MVLIVGDDQVVGRRDGDSGRLLQLPVLRPHRADLAQELALSSEDLHAPVALRDGGGVSCVFHTVVVQRKGGSCVLHLVSDDDELRSRRVDPDRDPAGHVELSALGALHAEAPDEGAVRLEDLRRSDRQ